MLTELINLRSLLAPMAWSNAALRRQRYSAALLGGFRDNFRLADDTLGTQFSRNLNLAECLRWIDAQ
jgi:hypothetical protein